MVYGRYHETFFPNANEGARLAIGFEAILNGVYKPMYNWGGHPVDTVHLSHFLANLLMVGIVLRNLII